MDFVITIIAVLLVVGSLIAIWWWRVSARIAPYGDEVQRRNRREAERQREIETNTVVIGRDGSARTEHDRPPQSSPKA